MIGSRSPGARELTTAAGFYAALCVLASWPLALHFTDHVPGGELWHARTIHAESLLDLWNLWWFRHALVDLGRDPFQCSYLLYPYGVNLWFHTLSPLYGLVGIVLQTFASLAATQNLMLLFDLVMAGVCAFALARHLGLERPGALLAGAIFAFSPKVFAHLYAGHFELIATYWLPALLLVFLRLLDASLPRLRDAALLGLLFVGAAYSSQYYFVYGAELLVLTALLRAGRVWRKPMLAPVAVTLLVVGIGVAPMLWNFLGGGGPHPDESSAVRADFDVFAGDLIGYFVPPFTHPLFGELLGSLHERLNPPGWLPHETTTYVGWVVLGLAGFGTLARWRAGKPVRLLLAVALVFGVLALGSHLRIAGYATGMPLPGRLFPELPVLRLARAPGRNLIVAMLGFAILAGEGWQAIHRRWLRGSILCLLAFEYAALPLPLVSTDVAPVYRRLAELPGDFAVLEVPLGVRDGRSGLGWPDNRQIFAQTVHGHPIVAAAVSRLPSEAWDRIHTTPVIGTLLDPPRATPEVLRRDRAEGPAFFARWRIDAVVVHPEMRGTALNRFVEEVLPIRSREDFADGSQLLWLREPGSP